MEFTDISADISEILYTEEQLQARLAEMAREIERDYAGKEVLIVGVLKGAVIVISDLIRELKFHAHIDFMSKIRNPIGVKLGPNTQPDDVRELIERLDPNREPGRLTFITRMGATKIREAMPKLVDAVKSTDSNPLWITDPMHGNGITTSNGYKSRRFDDVMDEVRGFFEVHRAAGTVPGGIHIELTGDDVAECLGGSEAIDEAELESRYESLCDPRLNHMQSLELAFLVAEQLSNAKK